MEAFLKIVVEFFSHFYKLKNGRSKIIGEIYTGRNYSFAAISISLTKKRRPLYQ